MIRTLSAIVFFNLFNYCAEAATISIRYTHTNSQQQQSTQFYRFTVSDSFTSSQRTAIRQALQIVYDEVGQHFREKHKHNDFSGISDFTKCVDDAARRRLDPFYQTRAQSAVFNANSVMTMMLVMGGRGGTINVMPESQRDGGDFTAAGRASVGRGENLNMTINPDILSTIDSRNLAGVIFHEALHRAGWSHPSTGTFATDYPETLIYEAGLCVQGGTATATRRLKSRTRGAPRILPY